MKQITFWLAFLAFSASYEGHEESSGERWLRMAARSGNSAQETAAYEQIARLQTCRFDQEDHRGSFSVLSWNKDSTSPTDLLYRMGLDVLPMLAEALDDETPTQTVTTNRGRDQRTWKVNELVARLVVRIADRDFASDKDSGALVLHESGQLAKSAPELKRSILDWYRENRDRTPAQRKIADVSDALFRNRFDAIEWLGTNKIAEGTEIIVARIIANYQPEKREVTSLTRSEMASCAFALGRIGDTASLSEVRRVCQDMSYRIYMSCRPISQGRFGLDSGMICDLFRAYEGLALLGAKTEALEELKSLFSMYSQQMEPHTRREFEERLHAAGNW